MSSADPELNATLMGCLERATLEAFDAQAELDWYKRAWPLVEKVLSAFRGPPVGVLKQVKALRAWLEANPKPVIPK